MKIADIVIDMDVKSGVFVEIIDENLRGYDFNLTPSQLISLQAQVEKACINAIGRTSLTEDKWDMDRKD